MSDASCQMSVTNRFLTSDIQTPTALFMAKIIVPIGAPGAGKGTQARLLKERLGLPHISTGDMFRAMKEAQTPLGEQVRGILASGELVPDDITARIVEDRTSR